MTTEVKSQKAEYDEALKTGLYNQQGINVAERVLDVFNTTAIASEYEETLKQIAEASKVGDVKQVLALSKKLNDIQHNRQNHEKALNDYKNKFTFSDILQAYSAEFSELKYEAALEAMKSAHIAVEQSGNTKGTRGRNKSADGVQAPKGDRPPKVYKITKDGKSIDFILRAGPAGLDQDKEAFEFLGFKLVPSADGKKSVLEPAEFVTSTGEKIKAARASIVKAMETGGVKMFEDYDCKEIKPTA
ncbi:hypothetical protein [Pseudomonas putida]|uniref:hypothetical protein n=1 Tax=Pseudomonas putida TaxID=303 RepID=UPI0037CB8B35